ncbi:LOW QUALITY PROTEIN: hypothetical protein Cgig2_014398 [Carnegiea gigantea]|uniref:Reverse transcriptase zinc-binding domain-containing protein n=1 Tax=Carnegiea gigantea TaxID=171969 RepID=A0A9Q1K1A0_9CARY|nr:LOW QUALITY PROTEIN: hypothetical protein Cgig2_014398 [Carnegiea gigantea]
MAIYMPREEIWGVGLKHLAAWNKPLIVKLVWVVAQKKDLLCVKWVHRRYIKDKTWWGYTPNQDCCWYWKKIYFIKEYFKDGVQMHSTGHGRITVPIRSWVSMANGESSKAWTFAHHKLPIKARLNRCMIQQETLYSLCQEADEDEQHLLYTCLFALETRQGLKTWWEFLGNSADQNLLTSLLIVRVSKTQSQISYAIFAVGLYYIWRARNYVIFEK